MEYGNFICNELDGKLFNQGINSNYDVEHYFDLFNAGFGHANKKNVYSYLHSMCIITGNISIAEKRYSTCNFKRKMLY